MTLSEFVKSKGYDSFSFVREEDDFKYYLVYNKSDEIEYDGIDFYVRESRNGEFYLLSFDESIEFTAGKKVDKVKNVRFER